MLRSCCFQRLRTWCSVSERSGADEAVKDGEVKQGKEIERVASSLRVDAIAAVGLNIGRR